MFLHNFVLTGKDHGWDLDAHIRKVISDCGVTLECDCPVGCDSVQANQVSITSEVLQFTIEQLAKQVAALQVRLDQLESQVSI